MPGHYTAGAKWFHWTIAALVGLEFLVAWIMPETRRGTPDILINTHMSIGVTIVAVMLFRLAWRLTHKPPALPAETSVLELYAARLTHGVLYLLLFIAPFAGWVYANSLGWKVRLFGMINLPSIVEKSTTLARSVGNIHSFLAYSILTLVGLHTLATVYHWYWRKDLVFEGMLPAHPHTDSVLNYFDKYRKYRSTKSAILYRLSPGSQRSRPMVYSEEKLKDMIKMVNKKFGSAGRRRIKSGRSARARATFAAGVDVAKVIRFVYKNT